VLFGAANPDAPTPSDASLAESWYLGVLLGALLWVGLVPSGPKLFGVPLFDPGLVTVVNSSTPDLSSPYAVPSPSASGPSPSPSSSPGGPPGSSPGGSPGAGSPGPSP
jgi:hypothetical protein